MSISPNRNDREFQKFSECDGKVVVDVKVCNTGDISSSATDSVSVAGENISATKVVYKSSGELFLATKDVELEARAVGFALTGASTGSNVLVRERGDLYDSSFSFVDGEPVFLDTMGDVTQTPPVSGFRVMLGYAIAVNGIRINIQEAIEL